MYIGLLTLIDGQNFNDNAVDEDDPNNVDDNNDNVDDNGDNVDGEDDGDKNKIDLLWPSFLFQLGDIILKNRKLNEY